MTTAYHRLIVRVHPPCCLASRFSSPIRCVLLAQGTLLGAVFGYEHPAM